MVSTDLLPGTGRDRAGAAGQRYVAAMHLTGRLVLRAVVITSLAACGPKPLASAKATRVASSEGATYAVTTAGELRGWGRAWLAGLVDASASTQAMDTDSAVPQVVKGLESGVADVSAWWMNSCAVLEDGRVKCWGQDNLGGTKAYGPVEVQGLPAVKHVSIGGSFACAVVPATGGVKCWGASVGTGLDAHGPQDVPGLTSGVKAVATGLRHACALLETGHVKCWGENQAGECGVASPIGDYAIVPEHPGDPLQEVPGLSDVEELAAGTAVTFARLKSGAVKVWGDVDHMAQANLQLPRTSSPVDLPGLGSGVTALSSSCAVQDGAVKCWGRSPGDGTIDPPTGAPVAAKGLSTAVQVVSSDLGGTSCALLADGAVKCWGGNSSGETGNGKIAASATGTEPTPVSVISLP